MLEKTLISIDIGTSSIKIAEGMKHGKGLKIKNLMSTDTPLTAFEDGYIRDMPLIKGEIVRLLKQHGVKAKEVIFTTKSSTIITRIIDVPMAKKDNEMETLIKYNIEQYLPINFDDYIIQYRIMRKFKAEDVEMAKVRVVVFPKEIAKGYLDLAESLKLTPIALDVNMNCVNKLFLSNNHINNEYYTQSKAIVVIDMGKSCFDFSVIRDGFIEFNRLIPTGGEYVNSEIARELMVNESEAEKLKIEVCNLDSKMFISEKNESLNAVVKSVVDEWVKEIYKMVEYYKSTNVGNYVDKIYIHGGTSELKSLEDYMTDTLNIKTDHIKSLPKLSFENKKMEFKLKRYLNSVGALIRLQ